MFLTDLQERLRNEQTRSGNVKLDYVHVVHGTTLSIQHGFEPEQDEAPAETEQPKPMSIAEAEGITGSLEDRLHTVGLSGIVSLTGAELAQLLEYREELKQVLRDEFSTSLPRLGEIMSEAAAALPADLDEEEKALEEQGKLDPGAAPIVKVPADANMREVEAAAAAFDAMKGTEMMIADLEGKGKEVRMPCPQFDENKVGCVLPFGHYSDHNFDPRSLEPSASGNITGPAKSEE